MRNNDFRRMVVLVFIASLFMAFFAWAVLKTNAINFDFQKKQTDNLNIQVKSFKEQLQKKEVEEQKLRDQLQSKIEAKAKAAVQNTPPAAPTQPTAAVVTPGGAVIASTGNCEAYRPLVAQYGWNVETAMQVMKAESGCNPNAVNRTDNHIVCIGSFGLFQISCHGGQITDPAQNVAAAWAKYTAPDPVTGGIKGWKPWGVCTSGKVRCV